MACRRRRPGRVGPALGWSSRWDHRCRSSHERHQRCQNHESAPGAHDAPGSRRYRYSEGACDMNNVVNRSSPELESQAAASRARLSGTLDELASNLTPGRMLDEVMSYSRHGGADFLRGLRNAAAANPIPAVLIGAGCAMFLSGKGRFSENMGSFAPKQQSASSSDGASRASPSQTGKGVVAGLKE